MRARCWFERWGGPILVVVIIVVSTFLAMLVLRELRPCGWLDITLRGDGCLCEGVNAAISPVEMSGFTRSWEPIFSGGFGV